MSRRVHASPSPADAAKHVLKGPERGGGRELATFTGIMSADVELLAGDPAAAASSQPKGAGCSRSWGNRAPCRPRAGILAQALYALDRLEEADAWAGRAAELGASDDAITQMLWRQVRAKGSHVAVRRKNPGGSPARR